MNSQIPKNIDRNNILTKEGVLHLFSIKNVLYD